MSHHEDDTTIARVMETLISNGVESMGEAFGILYNAAMEMERAHFLGAGRYERIENRVLLVPGGRHSYRDTTPAPDECSRHC
jgi:hypothetical protein